VEEAALLMPVQRVVGGIEIEDDLVGRPRMRLQEQRHRQRLDRRFVVSDLVVARRLQPAQFQPVQRRLARQRCAGLAFARKLSRQHRQHGIVPQIVMVIEVFIAERNPEHPLANQGGQRMLHQILAAAIAKAGRKSIHQINHSICRAQK